MPIEHCKPGACDRVQPGCTFSFIHRYIITSGDLVNPQKLDADSTFSTASRGRRILIPHQKKKAGADTPCSHNFRGAPVAVALKPNLCRRSSFVSGSTTP